MNKLLLPFALLAALSVKGQSPCAQLTVEQVRYDAFNPSAIELIVDNQSTELFSYPSFVLVDGQGDTLAGEQVNFFGIGGQQAHYMLAEPGVTLPSGTFDATLLLYTSFGDSLSCTWDLQDITLCPTDSCVQAEIYLTNTGTLIPFSAYWWVSDATDGSWVAQGYLDMDDVTATHFDTVCLAPGNYRLEFSPFSPIDQSYVAGITTNYAFSIGTNVALQQDTTPLDLDFGWYAACADITNGMDEARPMLPLVIVDSGTLLISDPLGRALGTVSVWGADGRLLASRGTNGSALTLSTAGMATGIVVVRCESSNGHTSAQRVLIP
ncbi:MAG: hypothetical protein JNL05_01880 [Flavobacteriales bacterium]|nr:hypothetical protein [Flavobacteriales bacterium]